MDPDANPDLLLARILDRARRIDASDASNGASSDELIVIRARALSRDVLTLDRLLGPGEYPWPYRWARRYENIPLPGEEAG